MIHARTKSCPFDDDRDVFIMGGQNFFLRIRSCKEKKCKHNRISLYARIMVVIHQVLHHHDPLKNNDVSFVNAAKLSMINALKANDVSFVNAIYTIKSFTPDNHNITKCSFVMK